MLKIEEVKSLSESEVVTLSDGNKLTVDKCDGRIRWMADYSKTDSYIRNGEVNQIGNKVYFI